MRERDDISWLQRVRETPTRGNSKMAAHLGPVRYVAGVTGVEPRLGARWELGPRLVCVGAGLRHRLRDDLLGRNYWRVHTSSFLGGVQYTVHGERRRIRRVLSHLLRRLGLGGNGVDDLRRVPWLARGYLGHGRCVRSE